MSQQIDNQIVKMQFDNASFEKNVQQSMSTLDKLKAALKFDKVDLSSVQQSLDNINMDKITNACDAVTNKFSLLGTIGDQIIRDLTTKFTSAAEKMVKSFTVDQVASGWEKYADKTTAVQTIMANTIGEVGEGLKWKDQAEQMAAVTEEIERLNWFTDETSYSLTDMTNNIGKFVAQKVPLEQATRAMMGISTWAAVSGQNKTQAQMAMYNLSQSLGANAVKAIDWKSIENANMATSEFKETVIETAKALGVLDEKTGEINKQFITAVKYSGPAEVTVANFRDTLSSGWFNSDVLMGALEKYGGFAEKINELYNVVNRNGMVSTTSNLLKLIDAVGEGSADADKQLRALAKNAEMDYADVKFLFEELNKDEYDLGKRAFAAAQEAKTFQEAIDATSDAVASEWMGIFETIFGNYLEAKELWTDLANSLWDIFAGPLDNIKWALIEWKDAEIEIGDAADGSLKKLSGREALLDAVSTAITNIGEAIEIVRSALAEVFPIFNLFVTEGEDAFDTSEGANAFVSFTKALHQFAESLKLSEDAAESLRTIVHVLAVGIKTAFNIVGGVFEGLFKLVGPIFNILDALFGVVGKFISAITGNDSVVGFADKMGEGADKLKTNYLVVMDKIAAVLNKIADVIRGMPETTLFKDIHDAIVRAKDSVVAFWDAFVNMPVIQQMIDDFNSTVEKIKEKVTPIIDGVTDSMDKMKESAEKTFNLTNLNSVLTKGYTKLKDFLKIIKDLATRVKDFFKGLKNGKSIVQSFKDSFGDIIDKIKEFKKLITDFFGELFDKGGELGEKFPLDKIKDAIHNFVENITPDQITMMAVATAFGLIALNMLRLSDALRNAVDAFTSVGVALKNVINSYIKKQKSTILQVAEAIVIVAASIWVLSKIPEKELDKAVGAIVTIGIVLGVLTAVLAGAGIAIHKFGGEKSMVEMAAALAIIAGAFFGITLAMKAMEYINMEGILPKILVAVAILAALSGLSILIGKLDKFNKGSLTVVAMAASLLLITESLVRISEIPTRNLTRSINTLYKLMLGLAAIVFASGKVGVFSAVGLIAIVMTLDKILPMIEKIVNYDYEKIKTGLENNEEIIKRVGLVIAAMVAIGAIAGNRLKGAAIAMLSIAGVFAALVGVAKLASLLKPSELKQGETFIFKMGALIAALMFFSRKTELGMWGGTNGGEGISKVFTRIAITMGILLGIAKLASLMEPADLIKGELALLGLVGIVGAMLFIAKLSGNPNGIIKSVTGMLFAISMILGEVAVLSVIPMEHMLPALGAVLGIMTAVGLMFLAMSKTMGVYDKNKFKGVSGVANAVVALLMIAFLGAVLIRLSDSNPESVLAAAGSIAGVVVAVGYLMRSLSKLRGKEFSVQQLQTFVGAVFLTAVLGAIVAAMCLFMKHFDIDPKTILSTAGALAIVMVGITPALLALSKFQSGSAYFKKMKVAILGAIGLLAVAAVSLGALNRFGGDPNTMIKSATALSIALVASCIPIAVLGFMSKFMQGTGGIDASWATVKQALVVLAGASAALIVLSNFANGDTVITSAIALGIALFAISIPIAVLGAVGELCKTANTGAMWSAVGGAIVAMAGIVTMLIWMANTLDISQVETLNAAIPILVTCMAGLSVMAIALAFAGTVASVIPGSVGAGFAAMEAALGVFLTLVLAIIALGAVLEQDYIPVQSALETGLDALVLIFGKLGEAVGALIGGFGVGLSNDLPYIADNLVTFSKRLKPFAENMKDINQDAVVGCKNIAEAMLYLAAAEFLEGITRLIGFFTGTTVGQFNFGPLGKGIADFCFAIKDIPSNVITKASTCSVIAKRLGEMMSLLDLEGGLVGLIFGEKDLKKFSDGVAAFGQAIIGFTNSVKNLDPKAPEIAQRAADAAVPMIDLSKTLYGSGGVVQWFLGDKDLGKFGESLTSFVASLVGFVRVLKGIEILDPEYGELIRRCADATQPMLSLANGIKNSGGVLAEWVGENTLDVFGETLIPFGASLKGFVSQLLGLEHLVPNYPDLIRKCVTVTRPLINLGNGIEEIGGLKSLFTGESDFAKFGLTLESFGVSLEMYTTSLANADLDKIASANEVVKELLGLGKTAAKEVPVGAFNGVQEVIGQIIQLPTSGLLATAETDAPLIEEAYKTLLDTLVTFFTNRIEEDKDDYEAYGDAIDNAIKVAMLDQFNLAILHNAVAELMRNIKEYFDLSMFDEDGNNIFEKYGEYVVLGFAKGITDNAEIAIEAARLMAEGANKATKEAIDSDSPSKVAYKFGSYYSQGFALGISDYSGEAVKAATEMSDDVILTANSILSSISEAISNDVDTQPTIRPVLDTSDIEEKARHIDGFFGDRDLAMAYSASSGVKTVANAKAESLFGSGSDEENSNAQNEGAPQQINFTQNNYSPKALSRIEIYRQTKNQVSMMKGVLANA